MPHLSRNQKILLAAVKILLALGLLAYLANVIQTQSGFERLMKEPKNWATLAAAQMLVLVGFSLSFVRWNLLVRALDLEFHLRDAFRLGSLGFMLNQVSPGSVGGDLLKAVFIAKEQPGKRTEAVATVLIDRAIGLYAMILVAAAGMLLLGFTSTLNRELQTIQNIIWAAAIVSTLGLSLATSAWATGPTVKKLADRLPVIGHTVTRILDAIAIYRSRRGYLFAAFGIALITHSMIISAYFLIGRSLPVYSPSFLETASIVPIGLVIGTLPLTPGGLGTLEAGMEFLYSTLGASEGDGAIIALTYRATTYIMAAVGACYYLTARKSIDRMIHDAETLAEELA